ncbi:MAG TPA: cyclophane-forming radical SAM/SPASM peptide maturase YhhB [Frankiaceae bacterium]|nr:cyclophane-forming radical SAM/SPASM peptide maturase YhhB [Frankiaceae bacterium]
MTADMAEAAHDETTTAPVLRCFLVKVASRCNLACDYCYMYEHADQSWRDQPHFLSAEVERAVSARIAEYVAVTGITSVSVVLHGGEPLLAGTERLCHFADDLRCAMPQGTRCDVSMQTNGVLLTAEVLDLLAAADIGVSLSLDGPAAVNDLHRLGPNGASSHTATERALELLADRPDVFAGVIAVIDPSTSPRDVLSYFAARRVPSLDLLLPDANHVRTPPGRDTDPDRYVRWLIEAFDIWFDEFPDMRLRTFDALLGAVCGRPSPTDAFGLGRVSLLTIETDGTYHDLDVLKITEHGATSLGLNVLDHPVSAAATSPRLAVHDRLLTIEGLSPQCQACREVAVCGGGAVPHRFGPNGFGNPSVYCRELLAMIGHVRRRLADTLVAARPAAEARRRGAGIDLAAFDVAAIAGETVGTFVERWRSEAAPRFSTALLRAKESDDAAALLAADPARLATVAITPSAVLWTRLDEAQRQGRPLRSLDGGYLRAAPSQLGAIRQRLAEPPVPRIHRDDPLLRMPFGDPIAFLPYDGADTTRAVDAVSAALALIDTYDMSLRREIDLLCTDIQLVIDKSAHPDKVVSFSDDSVPGALYVSPVAGGDLVDVIDLADSIIHEHRHQKLYLLSREVDLVAADRPLVKSPWRAEPRPPSGVLHAVFVFVELRAFWTWIADHGPVTLRARAQREVATILQRLREGVAVLADVSLTPAGEELVAMLDRRAGL